MPDWRVAWRKGLQPMGGSLQEPMGGGLPELVGGSCAGDEPSDRVAGWEAG